MYQKAIDVRTLRNPFHLVLSYDIESAEDKNFQLMSICFHALKAHENKLT